jgi:uncharacterized repeat protein (TIGR01451 family)
VSFKKARGIALATALTLLTAAALVLSGTGAARPPEAAQLQPLEPGPAHWFGRGQYGTWGRLPARLAAGDRTSKVLVDNLSNPGNNEIMPTTNTYLIFWLPAGFHFSGRTGGLTDTDYENAMIRYFQDVGGSQILNTTTQYCGSNGCPADTSTFVASVVDSTAYPHAGTTADPLHRSDLANEIAAQIGANSWPLDSLSVMYFIFLPDNVVDCNNAGTDCNTNKYCAYHTYDSSGGKIFVWSDIPDNRSIYTTGGCGNSNVTGDNAADTTLSSVEHEHMEGITDPKINAWMDSTGAENGDKCNRGMGVADSSSTTANNYLGPGHTHLFRIQREWSNAVSDCAASYTTTGSFVESPAPTGGDVVKSVTEATIPGNASDTVHYTLTFTNPSHQDDAFGISVTDTLPAGLQSSGSGTVTHSFGDLAPHQSATFSFTAHPTGNLLAGTTLTNSATFDFKDSTGTSQPSITRAAVTTVVNAPPTLNLPGPQSQDYHDALSFGISASDADAGDSIALSASGLPAGLTFVDNGDRTGTVSGTITATPGVYTVTFSADDHHHVSPVTGSLTITVTREETTAAYTGPTVIAQGNPVTLSGRLLEDGTVAPSPAGQTLTLSVGSQSCPGIVDSAGNASCTIPNVTVPQGPVTLKAEFAGDTYYLPSSATASGFVFAFPARGDFVLGDTTVAGAGPSTTVTWWGPQWAGLNALTGGAAPASFKGFAATPSTDPPACGETWTSDPGNSSRPVSSVPAYMGVAVSSQVTQTGSSLSGDIVHIVVVKTDPGYRANPGHAGTGKIVATYC